jgi:hypothetical protein
MREVVPISIRNHRNFTFRTDAFTLAAIFGGLTFGWQCVTRMRWKMQSAERGSNRSWNETARENSDSNFQVTGA